MVVNGVAKVTDPQGQVRYVSSKLKTRIGFLPTGALLKLDCDLSEIEVEAGQAFSIPLTISRAKGLTGTARVELVRDERQEQILSAETLTIGSNQSGATLPVETSVDSAFIGERSITVRATVMQGGQLPVISEDQVLVAFVSPKQN